ASHTFRPGSRMYVVNEQRLMAQSPPPSAMPPAEPLEPVSQFNHEIHRLLKLRNAEARSLLVYIDRSLRQFRLQGRFSVIEIFAIAYLRGIEKLSRTPNDPIQKPAAWMRKTIFNVIREKSRESKKECSLVFDIEDDAEQLVDDETINLDILAVTEAFQCLSIQEQKILRLKHVEGQSWKEVLASMNEPYLSLSALRKRGQRALDKLRIEYHNIRPPIDREA
ncbi:MAG: sigma-70 family RNA polymerase sigma factor, partial [Cyanobacteria bacterium P01_A01_bin.105]